MNSTASTQISSPASKTVTEIFPLIGFIQRNIFQTFGIAITLVGILGYTAGKSFHEGWYRAAGTPPSLFPADAYEFVLQGLMLNSPWAYGAAMLGTLLLALMIMYGLDAWQNERNKLIRNLRKNYESSGARRARYRAAIAARIEQPKGMAFQKWKALEPRGNWAIKRKMNLVKARRKYPYTRIIALFFLQISAILLLAGIFWILKSIIVDEARASGVREYVGIYAAVTGRIPPQFSKNSIRPERLKEFACKGGDELWKYRTINDQVKNSKESFAYLLRGTDKFVLLLNPTTGSTIRPLSDNFLELKETLNRPRSEILSSCIKEG